MVQRLLSLAAFAAVAIASPQQLDIAGINAAPVVADGPVWLAGNPIQTASLVTTFPSPAPTNAPEVIAKRSGIQKRDTIISADTVISAKAAALGSTSITTQVLAGVSLWLNGASTHNIYGNINNAGRIVISQTSYLLTSLLGGGGQSCSWSGHDAYNGNLVNAIGALFQINDITGLAAASYSLKLRALINLGTLQLCGRGDLGIGSSFEISTDLDAVNSGLISYEQYGGNAGANFLWHTTASASASASVNLYNNGTFRLINTVYHNIQNVLGNGGCWHIGLGATLFLEAGTAANLVQGVNPFSGQTIYFADATAVLHLDAGVYAKTPIFGATISGFATGNAIEFAETIKTYTYVAATGNLIVTFTSGKSVTLFIGLGFDATAFVKRTRGLLGLNAIFYVGLKVNLSIPPVCLPSVPLCSPLPYTLPPYGTKTSTVTKPTSTTVPTTTSSAPVITTTSTSSTSSTPTSTSTSSVVPTTTSSVVPTTTSAAPITTSSATTSTVVSTVTSAYQRPTCPIKGRKPYYAALATGYTTDPALSATSTTTANQPCPTQPEAGTECGFINPLDPCAPQPDGFGPVPTPDTVPAFYNYSVLHDAAQAAPKVIPSYADASGNPYVQVFTDLNKSVQAQSFLGQYNLETYNATQCAALCDCTKLCTAFNIFAERDPSLAPSRASDNSTAYTVWGYECPNPPSMTSFKCTLWGSYIDASNAKNNGQYRADFHVVITASDGYDRTNGTTPADPTGPAPGSSTTTLTTFVSSTSTTLSTVSTTSVPTTSDVPTTSSVPTSSVPTSTATIITTTASAPSYYSPPPTYTRPPSHPWTHPQNCAGHAVDAPDYHLSSYFFPGPYNPQACADYALAQSSININAYASLSASAQVGGLLNVGAGVSASAGVSVQTAKFFNAAYLHKNGEPWGTYCSLYNSLLDVSIVGTNTGIISADGISFEVKQCFTWDLAISL
jgi:hypothetical protein